MVLVRSLPNTRANCSTFAPVIELLVIIPRDGQVMDSFYMVVGADIMSIVTTLTWRMRVPVDRRYGVKLFVMVRSNGRLDYVEALVKPFSRF